MIGNSIVTQLKQPGLYSLLCSVNGSSFVKTPIVNGKYHVLISILLSLGMRSISFGQVAPDTSIDIWSGTVTVGTWGNAFGNGNATGYGYSSRQNAGSLSNTTFTFKGTDYTVYGIGTSYIGSRSIISLGLTINPAFPACYRNRLRFLDVLLSRASAGGTYEGHSTYIWHGPGGVVIPRSQGFQFIARIVLVPTAPDAPVVAAINEGNQVILHWITPCDGGIDITGHEYREKAANGLLGSWTRIPNSAAGEVNATSYTVSGLNNPTEYSFEVRAVNGLGDGEISAEAVVRNPSVPLGDRTPQVRDGIVAVVPDVSDYRNVTEAHLAAVAALGLRRRNITSLKPGDFSGMTALTLLSLQSNQLSSLPDSIFEGLTAMTHLNLEGNSVTPLPLSVSLERVAEGQFKAVAPTGAPFEIVLPVFVTDGSISGGANTVTIPKGSVESTPFTVIRTPGTWDPVAADLGTLPGLPANHFGYALVKVGTVSYDSDGDGLIEIGSLAQLNAVRWDLDGDGAVDDNANAAAYAQAFPNAVPGMGCPTTADDADDNDCIGYELTADLDFDINGDGSVDAADAYWNGGAGWLPIGSSGSGNEFVATFEGNRHTIDNLHIERSTSTVGLFGVVGPRGQVRNVGIRKVYSGGDDGCVVGGLVGINRGGISGSIAMGLAQTGESGSVGVLAGANTGIIAFSYATGKSYCGNSSNAGGLVGLHGGSDGGSIITASYATSSVSGSDGSDLGGLAGQVAVVGSGTRGIITASYATGSVYGESESSNVGGLVGQTAALGNDCKAIIAASYATGEVEGVGSNVGGLVGHNLSGGTDSGGIVSASYATGAVTGSGHGNVGGLVGKDSTNLNSMNTVSHSYWNTETSGQISSDGGTGKTTAELVTPTGYAGIYATWNLDLDDDNTKDDPWEFGNTNEYPMLRADFDGDGDVDVDDVNPQRRVTSSPALSTDFNGDGTTDFVDFFLFADAFGTSDARFDLDGNGTVDFVDFFRFVDAFGT